jgi:hypothetical protein
VPEWLTVVSIVSLAGAGACALVIAADILTGRRQRMWIMNVVWPVTALYAGPLGLLAYFRVGRRAARRSESESRPHCGDEKPFWQAVAVGATHCGAGCTLGDLTAEWFLVLFPVSLFGRRIFGGWLVDYLAAYLFGIAFQYFSIKPMRALSPGRALVAAIKADTLSLTSWQVGMYGWMAVAVFVLFGRELPQTDPVFWFMMQIAMLFGFATAYPVNWWLIRAGIKERM